MILDDSFPSFPLFELSQCLPGGCCLLKNSVVRFFHRPNCIPQSTPPSGLLIFFFLLLVKTPFPLCRRCVLFKGRFRRSSSIGHPPFFSLPPPDVLLPPESLPPDTFSFSWIGFWGYAGHLDGYSSTAKESYRTKSLSQLFFLSLSLYPFEKPLSLKFRFDACLSPAFPL